MNDGNGTRLFVYGTLKRGLCRHGALAGQQFLGEAVTAAKYRMFNVGTYPGLIETPDEGRSIQGELWLTAPGQLAHLDEVEGVDIGLYARREISLILPEQGTAEAYLYLGAIDGCPDCGDRWE